MSEFLRVERKGAVAIVWIDRQAKMNTMTVAMRNEFPGIFAGLGTDAAVRGGVARGAGGGGTVGRDGQAKKITVTYAMRIESPGSFAALETDAAVRVVVVRGAGGKA